VLPEQQCRSGQAQAHPSDLRGDTILNHLAALGQAGGSLKKGLFGLGKSSSAAK
jgi:signal transduction histidine kinase